MLIDKFSLFSFCLFQSGALIYFTSEFISPATNKCTCPSFPPLNAAPINSLFLQWARDGGGTEGRGRKGKTWK